MNNIPRITRSLIIANVICYMLQMAAENVMGADMLTYYGGLWPAQSPFFHFWQPTTYMFLHGSLTHLFFNMFSLWMFGRIIEQSMGERRFLLFYFVCGLGAALCQIVWQLFTGEYVPTVGASGACYGILLAFGMFYPNERIMLIFPPIPMKAKYFVAGYAAIEVFSAFNTNSNIAHLAHLGGMLFGWLLITWWRSEARRPRTRKNKYENWHTADYDYNLEQRRRQERVDELLDKVRTSGYEGLTEEEKRELFTYTR